MLLVWLACWYGSLVGYGRMRLDIFADATAYLYRLFVNNKILIFDLAAELSVSCVQIIEI